MHRFAAILLAFLPLAAPGAADEAGALFQRGRTAMERSEFHDAVDMFTAVIRLQPSDAEALYNRAAAYAGLREFNSALKDLDDAVRSDPKYADAYNFRGVIHQSRGEVEKALVEFNTAVALRADAKYYFNRGEIFLLKQDYRRAVLDYDEAIKLNPKDPSPYINRGNARRRLQQTPEAIADYKEALKLDPKNVAAHLNLANAFRATGRLDEAIAEFTETIALEPNSAEAFNDRGLAYRAKQDLAKAIADYLQSIRLNPRSAAPYSNVALIYAMGPDPKFRDGPKGVETALKACQLTDWKQNGFIMILAAAYAEAGNFDEAVRWQNEYLKNLTGAQSTNARARLVDYQEHRKYPFTQAGGRRGAPPATAQPVTPAAK